MSERSRRARFLAVGTVAAVAAAALTVVVAAGFRTSSGLEARLTSAPSVASTPITALSSPPSVASRPAAPVTADREWVADRAARTGIPEPAMRAYAAAALRERARTPGCGLGWSTLAGIGEVETHHGTIGRRTLTPDGKAFPRITGIALDGGDTDRIQDTDGGSLDGDPRWDRAIGPMQFIPETWRTWGVDADGDGLADPDDLDDAAATAAAYLCADGHELGNHAGWVAAVGSYNHHEDYVRAVAEAANRYGSLT
ncbi:MAG: lytic murein transglycosylase [Curtobacterium sp.]